MIECRLTHVVIDESSDAQSVHIGEVDGDRHLIIAIGQLEAAAIDRALRGERFARPLTHDLVVQLVTILDHRIVEVRIIRVEQGTYYADLVLLDTEEREVLVDCRPSDALALLARMPVAKLYVAEDLLSA